MVARFRAKPDVAGNHLMLFRSFRLAGDRLRSAAATTQSCTAQTRRTMSIDNLTIIGERINPGFRRSKELLDNKDLDGIRDMAVMQAEKGADYLTINVGDASTDDPDFLVDLIHTVQDAVSIPLSFDYPGKDVQTLCLSTYDDAKADGKKPIVNSISELRLDMLELIGERPFRMILMVSERSDGDDRLPNRTAEDVHQTARRLTELVLAQDGGMTADDILVDVSIGPMASDSEGVIKQAIESIRLIGSDPDLKGVHPVVGLSNLSIMLPGRAIDGSLLKVQLESAFLTMAMPLGLDTILGTAGRDYQILPEDNFIYQGFKDTLECTGFDALTELMKLYREE
jgi:cobalamin-dependent methionine synthase I